MTIMERQLKIEKDANTYSYDRFMSETSKRLQMGAASELPEGTLLIKTTIEKVANKLEEYFKAPLKGKHKLTRMYLEDYFDRPKDLALLVISSIINVVVTVDVAPVVRCSTALTRALHDDYYMSRLKNNEPKLYSYIEREFKKRGKGYINSRKVKLGIMKSKLRNEELSPIHLELSTLLMDLVVKSGCNLITIGNIRKNNNKQQLVIQLTSEALELINLSRENSLKMFKKYPILITEPSEWSSSSIYGNNGYYSKDIYEGTWIKSNYRNKKILDKYIMSKPCDRYVSILNKLSKTSWRINKKVYDVIDYIMTENLVDETSPRNNPQLIGGLPFNRKQEASDYVRASDYGTIHDKDHKWAGMPTDRQAYKEWYRDCEIQKEKIVVSVSKAVALNLAMIAAKDYYNEPNIYFSYQGDFRGRAYPIQQHLNPQCKGEIKALLEFSKGYPIENEEQLRWFKIHGANCYGYDKLEYEDRVNEIDKKEEEIHLIATDPIRYRELWSYTDEPFLYLAWCFEYHDYIQSPTTFRSHIAIALDATCSGIQIYSGLLLDGDGAKEVNVIGDTRSDIYQKVAKRVNGYLIDGDYPKEITFNKSDGTVNTSSTIAEATSLKGKIPRSLVKRNVMTQPYSVTSYGMYQQLIDELNAMENNNKVIWKGDKWVVARMLTTLNDRAIVETVKGARIGQEFLKKVTKEITANNNYIFFTTPIIEFPVLQKINRTKSTRIRTELGRLSITTYTDDIHVIKMINGIAPNFIHSLDATLMFMTVEKMLDDCSDFHLIHDSFGVPVTHIDLLNKSVREAYIELFSSNPLQKFIKQTIPSRLKEADDVMINTLDLNKVRESRYIFS